jgi:hypothetical protein
MSNQQNETRVAALSGVLAGALIIALTAMALSTAPFSPHQGFAQVELMPDLDDAHVIPAGKVLDQQ